MANLYDIPLLITIGDGQGGNAISSIKEYLRSIIKANSVATFLSHKANMYGDASQGAIRVRIPQMLASNTYNPKGGNATEEMQVSEVIVPIDNKRIIKTMVDGFDLYQFQNSGAYQAEVLGQIATAIIADLNANFYLTIANTLKTNKQQVIELPNLDVDISDDFAQAKKDAYQLSRFLNKQKAVFDKIHYSLETADILTVINSNSQLNLISSLTTGVAGDKAIDIQVAGSNIVAQSIYGNNYTIDNMVLGNTLPSGSSFSTDEEFDFSNLTAVCVYAGAVACASYVESLVTTIDPDTLNPIVGSKYLFGIKVVLPQFVWAGVRDKSSYTNNLTGTSLNLLGNAINPTTLKVFDLPQSIDLSDLGTISVTSSNEDVATVAYADGVVTVTKVANGDATITVSSDNGITKAGTKVITFA